LVFTVVMTGLLLEYEILWAGRPYLRGEDLGLFWKCNNKKSGPCTKASEGKIVDIKLLTQAAPYFFSKGLLVSNKYLMMIRQPY